MKALYFGAIALVSGAMANTIVAAQAASQASPDGEQAYVECAACHTFDSSKAAIGPAMDGIIGRKIAGEPGYRYSNPMKRQQGVWTRDALDRFLANPQAAIPGNKMPYAGMRDPVQRAALIEYMQSIPRK